MSRRLAPWIVLFALLWHAMAGAALALVSDVQHDDHAALHWLEEGHHHGNDGGVQADDSPASVQHLLADGCSHASGLLPAEPAVPQAPEGRVVLVHSLVILPSPDLDAPRRPPRSPD